MGRKSWGIVIGSKRQTCADWGDPGNADTKGGSADGIAIYIYSDRPLANRAANREGACANREGRANKRVVGIEVVCSVGVGGHGFILAWNAASPSRDAGGGRRRCDHRWCKESVHR